MTDRPVLDPVALASLSETTGDEPEFLAELIDSYLADAVELFATIDAANAAGNPAELRRAAHSLKSNSATFGATTLATLARDLEELGKTEQLNGASALLEEARAEFGRVEVCLRETREPS